MHKYARCYILMLLRDTIFMDKSSDRVHLMWVQLLLDSPTHEGTVEEVLALHGCTESYGRQVIRQLARLVGPCCWSSIGHGPGSHFYALMLSMARQ